MIDDVIRDEMVKKALEATKHSYVPYSHYPVGACLRTTDGELISGSNVENASFGLTCCAERSAVFAAVSVGHRSFDAIAVANGGDDMPYPCGACRQVLSEFCKPEAQVFICNQKGEYESYTLGEILPHSFQKEQVLSE